MVTIKFQAQVKQKKQDTTYTSQKYPIIVYMWHVTVLDNLLFYWPAMKITKINVDCFNWL